MIEVKEVWGRRCREASQDQKNINIESCIILIN